MDNIRHQIRHSQVLKDVSYILVGVSGGIDSVTLLHGLYVCGYHCVVAHCNFHLRGQDSDGDASFVEELAKTYDFPFCRADFDTKTVATENKVSIEMAARQLRYDWFEKMRQKYGCDCIAVAHHADDAIETFFLNLSRGTGLNGLSGMNEQNGYVVRPLLFVFRNEIEAYVQKNKLQYREDFTNADTAFQRNRIRHDIVPLFLKLNPSFNIVMQKNMQHLNDEKLLNDYLMSKIKSEVLTFKNSYIYISISRLMHYPAVNTVLYKILSEYGFNESVVNDIYNGLYKESGKQYFSNDYRLVKGNDLLMLSKQTANSDDVYMIEFGEKDINNPLKLHFSYLNKIIDYKIDKLNNAANLDIDKLTFPLVLRKWRHGDSFYPFGMKGRKKLSDFFVDKKINLIEKENIWVLTSNEEIVWIIGFRIDNRYAVTNKTTSILYIVET